MAEGRERHVEICCSSREGVRYAARAARVSGMPSGSASVNARVAGSMLISPLQF
jgi:hypothetical protein